jgi:predicted transglutaminase-like cysteine proteinase
MRNLLAGYGFVPWAQGTSRGGSTVIFSIFSSTLRGVLIATVVGCLTHAFPVTAEAQPLTQLTHIPVSHITQAPVGWIDFCARQPNECAGPAIRLHEFVVTPKRWNDLLHVNKLVNATIKPLTDLQHWGVVERWSYPDDGYGDCEDYALLKRRILIQSGWPREALLVTVVRGKNDQGHAVLTVATDKGDFILDNQNDEILLWWETDYHFVKRQSRSDPNVWVSLGNPLRVIVTATPRRSPGQPSDAHAFSAAANQEKLSTNAPHAKRSRKEN